MWQVSFRPGRIMRYKTARYKVASLNLLFFPASAPLVAGACLNINLIKCLKLPMISLCLAVVEPLR